jgi:hypothetical protein
MANNFSDDCFKNNRKKMKVSEIISTASTSSYPESYKHNFSDNSVKTNAFDGLMFSETLNDGSHYLGLFDNEKLISYLSLSDRGSGIYQISYSATDPKYQRRGCFRYLLMKALESHGEILSDTHQSPEAQLAWKSLIKNPSNRMRIYVYNEFTNDRIDATTIPENDIWNAKSNPILLASSKHLTNEEIQRDLIRDIKTKPYNRDYLSTWFGKDHMVIGYNP